ncbi:5-formyltetrahydrofolate cyclo-ligase [Paracraurococcus sp. LOR1-02]|uniref:5-formyltetrahydrofolate cyclo-ligase n=1 Tax=Paracraurococcus lichenis TaxID=3064888 RepID=A0ABT9E6G1_9PROT|nr:5-formyltetrahydrofolate cyclo-ligase [Paracraurococcus sp. LOR1-02]MDO9711763.1 5-formyltetrahydrofolate cyclo-ligase [Paracraurococcus sp. LOR1-02]
MPDLVLAPVVGFDGEGFRLGYGGGRVNPVASAQPGSSQSWRSGQLQRQCWRLLQYRQSVLRKRKEILMVSVLRLTGEWVQEHCRSTEIFGL